MVVYDAWRVCVCVLSVKHACKRERERERQLNEGTNEKKKNEKPSNSHQIDAIMDTNCMPPHPHHPIYICYSHYALHTASCETIISLLTFNKNRIIFLHPHENAEVRRFGQVVFPPLLSSSPAYVFIAIALFKWFFGLFLFYSHFLPLPRYFPMWVFVFVCKPSAWHSDDEQCCQFTALWYTKIFMREIQK